MQRKNSECCLLALLAFLFSCGASCNEYDMDDLRKFDNHLFCLRTHCPDLYNEYVVEGKFYRAVENIYLRYRNCMKMCKATREPTESGHGEVTQWPISDSRTN
uniref:BPTI/Kunitz inhibitor domain-containing protein n=1 Tax=Trichuris muris TaxID=70415 RepID=A0A5S6QIA5_TRIMR